MVKEWKGIKEIREKATKELVGMKENGYLFYSAPIGYKLFLTIILNRPSVWRFEIKDFGIALDKRKNEILRRGFLTGDEGIVSENDDPILELIKNETMDVEKLKKHIKDEYIKSKLRVQGRAIDDMDGDQL
jgi:hypothetical protein